MLYDVQVTRQMTSQSELTPVAHVSPYHSPHVIVMSLQVCNYKYLVCVHNLEYLAELVELRGLFYVSCFTRDLFTAVGIIR